MNSRIYIINGSGGCGKTSFEIACQDMIGSSCFIMSTIDFVKEIAKKCGWDGTKSLENRKFLSDLKDLLSEWGNIPFLKVATAIDFEMESWPDIPFVFFVDVREPEEIQKFVDRYGAKTVLIKRDGVGVITSNHADADVDKYDYDIVIYNNGTKRDLSISALEFLKNEGIKYNWGFEIDLEGNVVR